MKKFEKELLFSQVEGETTTGSGNGTTGENAGEGENDAPEQEPVDEGAEDDNNMTDRMALPRVKLLMDKATPRPSKHKMDKTALPPDKIRKDKEQTPVMIWKKIFQA